MHILLALPSLHRGGTESQVTRLAVGLKARGHRVTVLCLRTEGPLRAILDANDIAIVDAGTGLQRLLLPWRIRRLRPAVVHTFLLRPCVVVLPAAMLAQVPLRICGWRGMAPSGGLVAWLQRVMYRIAALCAHSHTVNANAITASLPAIIRSRPPRVILNGVDIPDLAADPAYEPPRGVVAANLLAYKGHLDLVAALSLIAEPPPIDCYGDGPQRDIVEQAIRAHGLAHVLSLRGTSHDIPAHYAQAQFAVLPSHEEGMPNALLEAMVAGLPCVATAVGGVPELIDHEVTGLLVPPHDPVRLAEAITRLATDPALRRKLGAAARERASAYAWAACVERHVELYRVH